MIYGTRRYAFDAFAMEMKLTPPGTYGTHAKDSIGAMDSIVTIR